MSFLVGVTLFLVSFLFLLLSIQHLDRVRKISYLKWRMMDVSMFLYFSLSLSPMHDDRAYIRALCRCSFRSVWCYFLFNMLFSSSIFLSFFFMCKRRREKERHINRGRWWRAHCWLFPSFCSHVCELLMLWKEVWFESRLRHSFFSSPVTYIVIASLSSMIA